ncbi:hypothetical protein [Bacterioplanoides sp.]|uniref:hypothetical protein n=1 Tax=Bacterioplanoides sp. TaxID=2066072 RepID=UPI003B5A13C5
MSLSKYMVSALAVAVLSGCGGSGGSSSDGGSSGGPDGGSGGGQDGGSGGVTNAAPTVSNLAITDNNGEQARVGDTLTLSYTYSDNDNDAEGASLIRWLRDGEAISGENGKSYTLATADVGKQISFEVTPVAVSGELTGTPVASDKVTVEQKIAPKNLAPEARDFSIIDNNGGLLLLGDDVSVSFTYFDAEGDKAGEHFIEWLADGEPINIVGFEFGIGRDQLGKKISARITPMARTGTEEGVPVLSDELSVANSIPYAEDQKIISSAGSDIYVGTTLTIDYTHRDLESDASAGPVDIQWYRRLPVAGQSTVKIDGATGTSYRVTTDDIGHIITVVFKPSAQTGASPGQSVTAGGGGQVSDNSAPSISKLHISKDCDARPLGLLKVGDQVNACYFYLDDDNDAQDGDKTTYRWVQINADRTETELGTTAALAVPFSARGKALKLYVKPYAKTGVVSGSVQSTSIIVDVEAMLYTSVGRYSDQLNKFGYYTDGSSERKNGVAISLGQVNGDNPQEGEITKAVRLGASLYSILRTYRSSGLIREIEIDGTSQRYIQPDQLNGLTKPNNLYAFANKMVLSGDAQDKGTELWVVRNIDGTLEFKQIELAPGSSSNPSSFVYAPEIDTLFFTAISYENGQSLGRELFKARIPDTGDDISVSLVKDIRAPGDEDRTRMGSVPLNLSWINGKLYFSAWDGKPTGPGYAGTGRTLWVSDGSESGTVSVTDLDTGKHSYPSNFASVDSNRIFFMSNETGSQDSGRLYVGFGTTNATELKFSGTHGDISHLTEFPANGSVLYKATATEDGVAYLWELKPQGNSYNPTRLSSIKDPLEKPLVKGKEIFYALKNSEGNYHLAKSVNTDLNTPVSFPLGDNDEPRQLTLLNDRIVFTANGQENNSRGVYFLDEKESNVPQLILNTNNGSTEAKHQPNLQLPTTLIDARE